MLKIGVVGATGAVGETFLELLAKRPEQYEVICFASEKSAGQTLTVGSQSFKVNLFSVQRAADCDIIFLCVSGHFALQYGEALAKHTFVVDNSSAFRYHDNVPLLVPPVNANDYGGERLIANPNCSSAIALMALGPLHAAYCLDSMIVSTYQAASGAGKPAMKELKDSVASFIDYARESDSKYFFHDLAYNVVPQVDRFEDNGYTKEEMKIVWEVRKVLRLPELPISATAVRVPTLRSHAESLSIRFKKPVRDIEKVREILRTSPGVILRDDTANSIYPMPKTSTYQHAVEVGRIRKSLIHGDYGLDIFISGDQLLRGAALNAFEILQLIRP